MKWLLVGLSFAAVSATSVTGDWVARQVQDRDTGRDSRATIHLTLYDRHGRARDRTLVMLAKRGTGGDDAGDKVLTRFTYPDDIKGTSFLVWEHASGDDERFLYLPSLGRVRRIAGAEAQESFVGTDFSYEDIGGREFDDYSYTLLDANASWRSADGKVYPAYRLESRRKQTGSKYPRVVSLITKDSFIVVAADVFNRRNEQEKTYTVKRLDRAQNIWTVFEAEMSNAMERTRTTLRIDRMEYNVGLKGADFSRRQLEAGAK